MTDPNFVVAREALQAIRDKCELAGSDHNPWPLQRECVECGIADCPTHLLAMQVKDDAVVALLALEAVEAAQAEPSGHRMLAWDGQDDGEFALVRCACGWSAGRLGPTDAFATYADHLQAVLAAQAERNKKIHAEAEQIRDGLTGERPMKRYDIRPHAEAILGLLGGATAEPDECPECGLKDGSHRYQCERGASTEPEDA